MKTDATYHWIDVNLPFGPTWDETFTEQPSFCREIGAKAGMLLWMRDGTRYLVGDINELGGGCDDCPTVRKNDIVSRYAVVWEESQTPRD